MDASSELVRIRREPSFYLWAGVFVLVLAGVVGGLYFATLEIDYVWRWYRVPQYFVTHRQIEVRADIKGEVAAIRKEGEATVVVVKGRDEEAVYPIEGGALQVAQGDTVYPGDLLAARAQWQPGILMEGLWLTLKVSVIAILFGILIGFVTGMARLSSNPALKWTAMTYIELIRGSPLLVQIMIWYFVLGTLINTLLAQQGIGQVPAIWFGVGSLATFAGAYVAEIVRAGIQSIHRGQTEAARSLGMNYFKCMRYVILPQAFRRIIPPLAGQFISLIKDSSLLGIIAIRELTKATREVVTTSLAPFELWFICAVLYLALTFTLSMLLQYLERRLLVS
jgi:polar amino acid transport system permease protein